MCCKGKKTPKKKKNPTNFGDHFNKKKISSVPYNLEMFHYFSYKMTAGYTSLSHTNFILKDDTKINYYNLGPIWCMFKFQC